MILENPGKKKWHDPGKKSGGRQAIAAPLPDVKVLIASPHGFQRTQIMTVFWKKYVDPRGLITPTDCSSESVMPMWLSHF